MKAAVICNAGAGSANGIQEAIEAAAARRGWPLIVPPDTASIPQAARKAVERGMERLVVVGGDGTLSQVINGVAPYLERIRLGIVPAGTGNDLARSLGLMNADVESLFAALQAERWTAIDVVRAANGDASSFYFLNAANGGFGGVVAEDVDPQSKQLWSGYAYWIAAVSKLVELRPYHVEIDYDGQRWHGDVYGLAIANGRYLGGGFKIAPDAWLDDGFLDITAVPILPTMELLAAGLSFALERERATEQVTTFRARQIHVRATPDLPFSIDGETTRMMDAHFEVMPAALQVIPGPEPVALQGRANDPAEAIESGSGP